MRVQDIIINKREGEELSQEEIQYMVEGYTKGEIPDYQVSAWLMAIYLKGMERNEIIYLTQAMLASGVRVDHSGLDGIPVDKHSTGGVGDKVSLPLIALVAAAGVPVPMISGRSLGHSGGTLDKIESIPGFETNLSLADYVKQVQEHGVALIGQTEEMAPADEKIYALRDVTATVPSIPLITASIMSKKAAGGTKGLVLDVKAGSGAFMKTEEEAIVLARTLKEVGEGLGLKISGFITNMDQPLGNTIGNSLEVLEALKVLKGTGPADVTDLVLTLGAEMLVLNGKAKDSRDGRMILQQILKEGKGLEKFAEIIKLQGGEDGILDHPEKLLPIAEDTYELKSPRNGFVRHIDTETLGLAAIHLGAGRMELDDDIDPAVGIEIHKKLGDEVKDGETMLTLRYTDFSDLEKCQELVEEAYRIGPNPIQPPQLIMRRF